MVQQAYYQTPGHVIAAASVLPVLDIFAVATRFYSRRRQRLPLATDDWLTIPAVLLVVGMGAALITGVALHAVAYPTPPLAARSNLDETDSAITITSQIEWAFYLMSHPCLGSIKLSFLFFYRRIFCPNKKNLASRFLDAMIVLVVLWTLGFFFSELFNCGTHFSALWGSTVDLMSCDKTEVHLLALVITDFITDAIILIFPIPLIWRLHMAVGRKLAVMAVFLLGSVAVAASLTRLVFIAHVFQVGFDPSADEDLIITLTLYWGMVENGLGLFAACLPTFRFAFKGFSPESLAASIRSALSLHSIRRSHSSHESESRFGTRQTAHEAGMGPGYASDASQTRMVETTQAKKYVSEESHTPENVHGDV